MTTTIFLIAITLLQSSPAFADNTKVASMNAKKPVEVTFRYSIEHDILKGAYTVFNHSDTPILIFDRIWNPETQHLDSNWVYVAITGKIAVLKRTLELIPKNLQVETPPVPYGREVAPSGSANGEFTVALPLTEANPYDEFLRELQGSKPSRAAKIRNLEFEVGWCLKSDLVEQNEPAPIKRDGESFWLFQYGQIENRLKSAKSAPAPVRLPAQAVPSPR